jgi:sugar lactone lactonase YvrE
MHLNNSSSSWKTRGAVLLAFSFAAVIPEALGFGEAQKYLIAASPTTSRLAYLKLPPDGQPATGLEPMRVLLDTGLLVPQGIAVDDYRKKLYVADPDQHNLIGYDIQYSGDALVLGPKQILVPNVEVRWVSVDGLGNVYFTDEVTNKIYKVAAATIEAWTQGTALTLYDATTEATVSSPGGIASDNYFVYWVNKASGTQAGTLIRAVGVPGATIPNVPSVSAMSKNIMKSYGVCLGANNIFYTDETTNMFAIARQGGVVQTVSTALAEPRGCIFDGSNTVYVADMMHNAIYQFASNAKDFYVQTPTLAKAADLQGAYGVAMFHRVMP